MADRTLQYQLSNGAWVDCEERTPEFLKRCAEFNDVSDVIAALIKGAILRNASDDWYSNCRYAPLPVAATPSDTTLRNCGHRVRPGNVRIMADGTSGCPTCADNEYFDNEGE